MTSTNKLRSRVRSDMCSLFFVKPNGRSNAHESAERLMRIKGVKEVMVTSGEYAFVVKSAAGETEDDIRQYLLRHHGDTETLECHYSYRR